MTDLFDIVGLSSGHQSSGFVTDPRQMQAMSNEQMAEYERRQGDPRNVPMSERYLGSQLANAWRPPVRPPTMTLAEYDARRAAYRPY